MEVFIREATDDDLPVVREMDRDVVMFVAGLDSSKDMEEVRTRHGDIFERWLNLHDQRIFLAFAGKENGLPVGFIWIVKNSEQFTGRSYCFVMDIGIKKGYRRLGIGKLLMDKARDYTKSLGYDRLKLMVNSKNKDAIKYYRTIGFDVEDLYMKKIL